MSRIRYLLSYVGWILLEIVKGSIVVAEGVYTTRTHSSPAIVEFPLRAETDVEIVAMASSITITPGTLVVGTAHGTAEDGASLFVHALFATSREQVVADLTEMEDRLLRATRGRGGAAATPLNRRGGHDVEYLDGRARSRQDQHGDPRPEDPEDRAARAPEAPSDREEER